LLEYLFQN